MGNPKEDKWFYRRDMVVIALFCLGPLALPLLFSSPRFTLLWKAAITVLVIGLTIWLVIVSGRIYLDFIKRLDELKAVYGLK